MAVLFCFDQFVCKMSVGYATLSFRMIMQLFLDKPLTESRFAEKGD